MRWTLPISLAGLAAFGVAEPEVFDFGELDQYKPREQTTPSLTGSSIWLSGTEEYGGFDLGISPDVKAKVQGVLEGCGQVDDNCYKEILEVLRSANFEIDHKIEGRAFRHFLSKTIKIAVKGALNIFLDIEAMLLLSWKLKFKELHGDLDSVAFIPASKVADAARLQTATDVVISAGGTAIITIKPTPNPTSLKGSHAPSVTTVTSAHDGLAQGDFILSLDENLASSMQEIMIRTMECEDGAKFDRENPTRRRANPRLGRAICAYHAVLINMGGTLSDLMQTDLDGLNFAIPAIPPDRFAAYERSLQLTEEYAQLMNLQVDRLRALAAYLFILTVSVTLEGQTLGENNKIPSTLIQTGAPTNKPAQTTASRSSSSTSSCPDPTATPLLCGREEDNENNCEVVTPKAKEDVPKCAESGEYPNCPCNMPTNMIVSFASDTEIKAMNGFMELFRIIKLPESQPKPSPQPEPPKEQTKALGILADFLARPGNLQDMQDWGKLYWNFFATDYGKAVDCRDDPVLTETRTFDPLKVTRSYPGGEFPLELFGEKCTYMNSGDNPGKLFCGDKVIECFWDPRTKDPANGKPEDIVYLCKDKWTRQTVFTCPF